ncbi:MAG: serine hydrolase [Bacteroidota bacterium]
MTKHLPLFILLFLSAAFAAWQQAPSTGKYAIDLPQKLDQYFKQAQSDWEVPGLSVAIVKDGKLVLAKGYGELELGKGTNTDGQTLYAIASNTKAFISAAIAMLVEDGRLDWDDPVIKHLPYFRMSDDYVTQNITVRDLLCHRSGLGTFSGDVIWYKSDYKAEEAIQRIKEIPPAFSFRSGYGYSNLMFITAGEVIKAVSGQSWSDFVKQRIFMPLGMTRTITSVNDLEQLGNVATPHKLFEGKHHPIAWTNWDNMGAAGGIISSVEDMAKWMQLQIDRGVHKGDTLFREGSQDEFWTPHNNFRVGRDNPFHPSRNFSAYGLGWSVSDKKGQKVVSHGGGYDGMYSRVAIVPGANLGVVVLTNGMRGISTALCNYVLDQYLSDGQRDWSEDLLVFQREREDQRKLLVAQLRADRQKDSSPSASPKAFTGRYESPMYGAIDVLQKDGKLQLHFVTAPKLDAELKHWHFNTYEILWKETHAWFDFGTLQFVMDNRGQAVELRFDVPNNDIFFDEIKAVRK